MTEFSLTDFELVANQKDDLNWYVIADSAQRKDLPGALVTNLYKVACLSGANQGTPLANWSPHLVQISSPGNDGSWRWLRRHAPRSFSATVLATSTSFDLLFERLCKCTDVTLPDGESMFFAFWDPAILATLVGQHDDSTRHVSGPVLTPAQRALLTYGIDAWWYWDRRGGLHSIAPLPSSEPSVDRLQLTQRQVDDLVEASVPDHLLHYITTNQPSLIEKFPPATHFSMVQQALRDARKIGLKTMQELTNYVCIALLYGRKLHDDPYISYLLTMVRHERLSFAGALADFPSC